MIVHPLTDAELASRTDLSDRDDIERLVVAFYRYAAMDELLGPVFSAAHVDWPGHIDTLIDFWAWQLLGERGYEGNPLRAHDPVHARTPFTDAHYDRWLDLFVSTIDEHFAGSVAEVAKGRAKKMAAAMRRLLNGLEHGQKGAATESIQPLWVDAPPR
jgi:truncated hemoglobin YjbI